mgnify:CR=1 FL=1
METTEEYAFTQTPLSASPQTPRYNTRNCPSSRIRSRSWSPVRLFSPAGYASRRNQTTPALRSRPPADSPVRWWSSAALLEENPQTGNHRADQDLGIFFGKPCNGLQKFAAVVALIAAQTKRVAVIRIQPLCLADKLLQITADDNALAVKVLPGRRETNWLKSSRKL